jgi:predicted RNA-binding Zn-ribbon protein involved in translation (DUF1610 family)
MKFMFKDGYIKCSTCGYLFSRDVPHEKSFQLQCPECGESSTYLIEWFINEIDEEEMDLVSEE